MLKKAQGWVENLFDWGNRLQSTEAEKLYGEAVRLARNRIFFEQFSVKDNVDGRFDVLSLIVIMLIQRLKDIGNDGRKLSQGLVDSMFADMDLSLREMGAGDIGVSKRVKTMAEAFLGRVEAYAEAIDSRDKYKLSKALERNLYRGILPDNLIDNGIVDFIFVLVDDLERQADKDILDGRVKICNFDDRDTS